MSSSKFTAIMDMIEKEFNLWEMDGWGEEIKAEIVNVEGPKGVALWEMDGYETSILMELVAKMC
jgi:hypothetical protein